MTNNSPIEWFDDFIGIAYRYFEIRMTVTPLFGDRMSKEGCKIMERDNPLVE